MSDPRPRLSRLRQIAQFGLRVVEHAGRRAALALCFLLLGSLTEGISILLLVPVLQLAGPQGGSVTVQVSPSALAALLGPQLTIGLVPVLGCLVFLVLLQAMFMRFKNIYMAELLYGFINDLRIRLF